MLERLLNSTENWTYLLVKDDISVNGRALLFSFVKEYLQRQYVVHYIAFDICSERIRERFPTSKAKLHCHDGHTQWKYSESESSINPASNLIKYLNKICDQENILLVIDSLSTLLIHQHPHLICKYFHSIKSSCEQNGTNIKILSLIHAHIHDESIIKSVEYLYSTSARLKLNPENEKTICQISHRRLNGKVVKEEEYFRIHDFNIVDVTKTEHRSTKIHSSEINANPIGDLSFKLTLDDKEKAARAQLILPYTILQSTQKKGDGEIIYEADINDDFDEEDPDDDLNI